MEPLHTKYATPILSVVVVITTALTTAAQGHIGWTEIWQLLAVALGAVGTYIVPVLSGGWRSGVKVSIAVLAAAVAAAIPLVQGTWSTASIVIIVMAGVQALVTHLGGTLRLEGIASTVGTDADPVAPAAAPAPVAAPKVDAPAAPATAPAAPAADPAAAATGLVPDAAGLI